MASPKTGIESLRRSWAATPSRSPHKPGPSDMQIDERPPPSPQMRVRASPRSVSPSRPRGHSPSPSRGSAEPKDPNTEIVQTLREMDARCSLVVNGNVWIGEREGSISIKNSDGATIHIIEKRKGAFVWSLVQVGNNVWAGCSDGFIRVLSSTTYKMERQFARHAGGGGGVQSLAFHKPSNTVFSGSNDFEILAWDATSSDFLRQFSSQSGVRALVADTHVLYSGTDDGSVSVWDILTGERIQQWTGHSKAVLSLTQTEKYVWSGSEDATIRIWNPTNGECIGVAEVHTGSVGVLTSVGNKVWSGAGDTVCLWDAERLELLGTYVAHEGYIDTITVIGKAALYKVWTSATDKNLKVWKSEIIPDETDELKRKLAHQQQVEYENRVLKEQIAQKDRALELAAQRQRELEEELARRKTVDMENAELRKAIAERDDTITLLRNQLDDSERRNARLTEDVATLGRLLDDLKLENAKLRADLDRTIHEKLLVEQKLQETIIAAEAKLQETIASYESKLRITIDSYETKLRDTIRAAEDKLAATVQSYETKLATTIQTYEAKLLETIQSYEAKLREAEDKLADTIARYEEKIALLTAQLNEANEQARFLRGELEKAKAENAHLNDELRKAWADIDAMSLKLKEMDTIFKSRLSLITDVFRTFKRYEQADRKLRATTGEGRDAFVVAMSEFKTTIANHFTDDELAHLGSSRHFFPVEPRIGSPATTRARSPAP